MLISKNRKKIIEKIDLTKSYEPIEAIKFLQENTYVKFKESLEVAINLRIDSNKTDQNIRGVLNLPKGTGKKIRVAVMAKGDKATEASDAGADIVGDSELIESITNGKIEFDHKSPDGTYRKGLNSSKIRDLGWKPKIKLVDGLKRVIQKRI